MLIDDSLSRQYAATEGVEPDQEQVSAFIARSKATLDALPAEERSVFRATLTEYAEAQLSLIELGRRELREAGTAKPTEQQALAEATRLRSAWAAKNADVSVDPRYGTYAKGALRPADGSLSVAVSKDAVAGGPRDARPDLGRLAARQPEVRLTLLLTSPRVAPGLLSWGAWSAVAAGVAVAWPRRPTPRSPGPWPLPGTRSQLLDGLGGPAAGGGPPRRRGVAGQRRGGGPAADRAGHRPRGRVRATGVEVEVLHGSYDVPGARLLDLVTVMDRLRSECPWDQQQTHRSLATYLLEETYETLEAIESGDYVHLREELGDLLLQVYFHARIAAEAGDEGFTIDDVAAGIVDKLVHRHPHVFAGLDVARRRRGEPQLGDAQGGREGPRPPCSRASRSALPALALADKVVGRAARVGVSPPAGSATLGERLLALVVEARAAGADPEQELRDAVRRLSRGRPRRRVTALGPTVPAPGSGCSASQPEREALAPLGQAGHPGALLGAVQGVEDLHPLQHDQLAVRDIGDRYVGRRTGLGRGVPVLTGHRDRVGDLVGGQHQVVAQHRRGRGVPARRRRPGPGQRRGGRLGVVEARRDHHQVGTGRVESGLRPGPAPPLPPPLRDCRRPCAERARRPGSDGAEGVADVLVQRDVTVLVAGLLEQRCRSLEQRAPGGPPARDPRTFADRCSSSTAATAPRPRTAP